MTVFEQVLQMLDEALDYQRHGELDEYSPFDLIDHLTLEGIEEILSTLNAMKRALQTLEKMGKQHMADRLVESGKEFNIRQDFFPAVRFGPTVYTYRPKPTDPKPANDVAFFQWLGTEAPRVVRPVIRKKQLREVAQERGASIQALIDSEIIEWEAPDEGKPALEVIDLHSQYAPKWAERVPDEWETKE